MIKNLTTSKVTTQFHVVYDDWFSSIPNFNHPDGGDELLNLQDLLHLSGGTREFYLDEEFDERGAPIPAPVLADEWMTQAERNLILQRVQDDPPLIPLAQPHMEPNPTFADIPDTVTEGAGLPVTALEGTDLPIPAPGGAPAQVPLPADCTAPPTFDGGVGPAEPGEGLRRSKRIAELKAMHNASASTAEVRLRELTS